MKIIGTDGLSNEQIDAELRAGARFIVFQYCISMVVISSKRSSSLYFVRAGESTNGRIAAFSALSLLLGWWGIPWGPIWTIGTIVQNLQGGLDVTDAVMKSVNVAAPIPQAPIPQALRPQPAAQSFAKL